MNICPSKTLNWHKVYGLVQWKECHAKIFVHEEKDNPIVGKQEPIGIGESAYKG